MAAPDIHPGLRPAVTAVAPPAADGTPAPTTPELLALIAGLQATVAQQQAALAAFPDLLAAAVQQQAATFNAALVAQFQAIVGGSSAQGLFTLREVMQHIADDETGAAQLLAQQNADRTRFAALETLPAALTATNTAVAAARAVADAALPLAGGTLTGPVYVQAPAAPASPAQASTLPLSMTFQQALPTVALGALYSFTVAVANCVVGQVVVLNLPPALLQGGTLYSVTVTAPGTVTVTLKAGVAIAAGSQTFYLRVLR